MVDKCMMSYTSWITAFIMPLTMLVTIWTGVGING